MMVLIFTEDLESPGSNYSTGQQAAEVVQTSQALGHMAVLSLGGYLLGPFSIMWLLTPSSLEEITDAKSTRYRKGTHSGEVAGM